MSLGQKQGAMQENVGLISAFPARIINWYMYLSTACIHRTDISFWCGGAALVIPAKGPHAGNSQMFRESITPNGCFPCCLLNSACPNCLKALYLRYIQLYYYQFF